MINPVNYPPISPLCLCLPSMRDVQCPTHGRFEPGDRVVMPGWTEQTLPVWGVHGAYVIEPKRVFPTDRGVRWNPHGKCELELAAAKAETVEVRARLAAAVKRVRHLSKVRSRLWELARELKSITTEPSE